jgi:hypothetical protein
VHFCAASTSAQRSAGDPNKPEPHDPVRIERHTNRGGGRSDLSPLLVLRFDRGSLVVLQPPNQLSVLEYTPWELARHGVRCSRSRLLTAWPPVDSVYAPIPCPK